MKLILFIAVTAIFSCTNTQKYKEEDKAVHSVTQLFKYVSNEKFDSIRGLLKSDLLSEANDEYLRIYLRDLIEVVKYEGIPSLSSFRVNAIDVGINDLSVTYFPDSPIGQLDSIQFIFNKRIGYDMIYGIKSFRNISVLDSIITK